MKKRDSQAPVRRRRKQPQIRQLEFYVISAQDLRRVRSSMETYVVAYVTSSSSKVKTHTDHFGGLNPAWNERLCLQIEEKLLAEDCNSQLTFDIYCHSRFRDKLVGTVRISLVDAVKAGRHPYPITSFLIFTLDGDSQGLLNVCVPPGGRFPKRLDSLSFKRVESDHGVKLEAVPSFKEAEHQVVTAAVVEESLGEGSSAAKADSGDDEELGIYDDRFFDDPQKPQS